MGVLQFDGVDDRLRWLSPNSTITTPLGDACTMAMLFKRDSISTGSEGLFVSYFPGAHADLGIAFWGSSDTDANQAFAPVDAGNSTFPSTFNNTTNTYMFALSQGTGTATPRLGWKAEPGGGWTHEDGDTTVNIGSVTALVAGATGDGNFLACHIGLLGIWSGTMSDANKEMLDDNWRTSDWWLNPHGTPVFLAELNVAGASVTDLAGNAGAITVTGTSLDAAETLDDWDFDGIAPEVPVEVAWLTA